MSASKTAQRIALVSDLEALQVLAHPLRVRLLSALREPASAATAARDIGEPRQKVNYHLKELERVGLVRPVEQRLVGNLVETLYQSVASTFVLADDALWSDPRRAQAMREQQSLERLVDIGRRLHRDATALLDRAAFDGEEIPSAAMEVEVRLGSEDERAAFLREVIKAIRPILDRHGRKSGTPYRVALAAYPDAKE
jgi:DNA-binding transcriptional ArsR family regulator